LIAVCRTGVCPDGAWLSIRIAIAIGIAIAIEVFGKPDPDPDPDPDSDRSQFVAGAVLQPLQKNAGRVLFSPFEKGG
jgi:hypothetical protein